MDTLFNQIIQGYRAQTFRLLPELRLHSPDEAIEYVNQRGFVFFWPITAVPYPSLWSAVAGDRPVASKHDDPGHVTWGWKDSLLGERKWYYAKILRGKATMISLDTAPYFYALTENYGAPESDYLTQYEQGGLSLEAKQVYETLLIEGPLDTIQLRRKTRLSSKESSSRFERALTHLQRDMKILPVGISRAGGWNYAFIYDIVPRHYPDLPDSARNISDDIARERLCEIYFHSVGGAQLKEVNKLFLWRADIAHKPVQNLVEKGVITRIPDASGGKAAWFVLSDLIR